MLYVLQQITDQKPIYSGRLLNGPEILRDVLKHTYDAGQTTHTVHLLCTHQHKEISGSQVSTLFGGN